MRPSVTTTMLDLLYPRRCAGCRGPVSTDERYLCWECLSQVLLVRPPFCQRCGDPIEGRVGHDYVCFTCSSMPIHFRRARSAARYDGVLRDILQTYKYRQGLWLGDDLVEMLVACFTTQFEAEAVDAVVAVPLHPSKRRERGFNQAEELARALARRLQKPLLKQVLSRVRSTGTQTHLTARQRLTNVTGAFRTLPGGRGKGLRLLLVDDVMTTGATVNEVARVLVEGGVASVDVLTLARG